RERRLKRWAMKDVAGMLRSFAYVGEASDVPGGREWARAAGDAFLSEYLECAAGSPFLPGSAAERDLLMDAMLVQKALSELRYDADHRRDWVHIPLRGLSELAER